MSGYNAVLGRNTENAPKGVGSFSQTVAFSHYNNFSAQLPIDPKSGKIVEGDVKAQAKQCFNNIDQIIQSIGHVMSDVVKITVFLTNIKDMDSVNEVYKGFFPTYVPTQTVVVVNALPMDAKVQVEALLTNGEGTIPNAPQAGDLVKLINQTMDAPLNPIANQTVAFSHYNNLSAQLPIDPSTGRIMSEDVKAQTLQCLKNIKGILDSIEVPLDDIVKITVYLKNLSDLEAVNEVYKTFLPDSAIARAVGYFPARTVVEVKELPMGALVQLEAVVSHGDGTPPQLIEDRHGIVIKANNTDKAPKCSLSTQTVAFSHYNHLSAQLPIDSQTGELVSEDVKTQAKQCLEHMKAIVESIGHSLEDVVKVNIYLKNIADLEAVNDVYKNYFSEGVPAGRIVGVSALPKNALVQMDAVVSNAEGTAPNL